MRILYFSCHSILERQEVQLFIDLGHEVFSMGSYVNPHNPHDKKRPAILNGKYNDHLVAVAEQCSRDDISQELVDWADIVYIMHRPDWIINNWAKIKAKTVVWRSIGQSSQNIENDLGYFKGEGIKIVRYSPKEKTIKDYVGEDAMIRFHLDPNEFSNWNGKNFSVLTVAQSMRDRNKYCGFEIFCEATAGMPRFLHGPGNENSGIPGGLLSFEDLKKAYRDHAVYFYTGTYPASYTLNFMEAFMTGIPIVAIGKNLADLKIFPQDTYEVSDFIENGVNGFISDNINELRGYVDKLLNDRGLAESISKNARESAVKLFGVDNIKKQWADFFNSL